MPIIDVTPGPGGHEPAGTTPDAEQTRRLQAMDQASADAEALFDIAWSAVQVCDWYERWYRFAGHKRLGAILRRQGKKAERPF
jgi:hypothetical protein